MTLTLEIGYEQLLRLFRQLPPTQKRQFLKEAALSAYHPEPTPEADYPRMDMASAAALLADDYLYDDELTVFTVLDAEELYEEG